jgi:hypothetical protein
MAQWIELAKPQCALGPFNREFGFTADSGDRRPAVISD